MSFTTTRLDPPIIESEARESINWYDLQTVVGGITAVVGGALTARAKGQEFMTLLRKIDKIREAARVASAGIVEVTPRLAKLPSGERVFSAIARRKAPLTYREFAMAGGGLLAGISAWIGGMYALFAPVLKLIFPSFYNNAPYIDPLEGRKFATILQDAQAKGVDLSETVATAPLGTLEQLTVLEELVEYMDPLPGGVSIATLNIKTPIRGLVPILQNKEVQPVLQLPTVSGDRIMPMLAVPLQDRPATAGHQPVIVPTKKFIETAIALGLAKNIEAIPASAEQTAESLTKKTPTKVAVPPLSIPLQLARPGAFARGDPRGMLDARELPDFRPPIARFGGGQYFLQGDNRIVPTFW